MDVCRDGAPGEMTERVLPVGGYTRESVTMLQIEPTTRCNFTCGFCCGRNFDQSDLDLSTFVEALEQFPTVKHLELQGEGEPLLHPDFFEMAKRATTRGVKVSTISNGSFFTAGRVEKLLDAGVASVLVSIESPDPGEFRKIRGGKLENVIAGIRRLLAARNEAGASGPVVGFAVTVLKDTQDRLPEIFELYDELGMDGGILVHMLSPMGTYSQFYDAETAGQVISKMAQALVWSRYAKLIERKGRRDSAVPHFWSEMFAKDGEPLDPARLPSYRSCPWLERGFYVNRHGQCTACPNIKDTDRHAFGKIGEPIDGMLRIRNEMGRELSSGQVPEACRGCFIADSIANRVRRSEKETEADRR